MKYILGLGTLIVGGALVSGACTQSDSQASPNPSRTTGGSGGSGTTSSGGTGGNDGTGGGTGGYATGGNNGTGGYDATGGSAGEGGWNAGGQAGEASTGDTGGSGGSGGECDGDDPVDNLPDCEDLPYAAASCDGDEPLGLTVCNQYAENATDEAFVSMFDCLKDLELNCSDEFPQIGGVNGCLADVPFDACESELAVTKCAAFGCIGEDKIDEGACVALLSSYTDEGVQSVIDCSNEATQTPSGSAWGGSSDVVACQDAFIECFVGTR